jgi:hypothetical protein
MCRQCATTKFKARRDGYVDGLIKFYLCGEESITTRGQAYKEYPYWISTDEAWRIIVDKYGSAWMVAQVIYEEKVSIHGAIGSAR